MAQSRLERIAISAVSGVYDVALQWWLEPLLTRHAEHKLAADVKRDLGFLFVHFGAEFVPNEKEYRWGKVVTVRTPNVYLRISKDRGEYGVALSPLGEPSTWVGVRDVLDVTMPNHDRPRYDPLLLPGWALLLEPHFPLIEQVFTPTQYAATRRALDQLRADAITRMKAEVEALQAERASRATKSQ